VGWLPKKSRFAGPVGERLLPLIARPGSCAEAVFRRRNRERPGSVSSHAEAATAVLWADLRLKTCQVPPCC